MRTAGGVGLLIASVFALLPMAARADASTVFLKDGGRIRGELMEVRPDKFVIVQTPTGETRRFEWSEVDHIAGPAAPPPPPPLQVPPPPPNAAPPEAAPATIVVRSNVPSTQVQLVTGRAVGYAYSYVEPVPVVMALNQSLCTAPCRYSLPLGDHELQVSAPGAPSASARFNLHPGENFLYARMGSAALVNTGYVAISVGVVALITGTSLLFAYGFNSNSFYYAGSYEWGLASVIGGAVLTGGGITMMMLGGSSLGPDPEHAAAHASSGLPPVRGVSWSTRF